MGLDRAAKRAKSSTVGDAFSTDARLYVTKVELDEAQPSAFLHNFFICLGLGLITLGVKTACKPLRYIDRDPTIENSIAECQPSVRSL